MRCIRLDSWDNPRAREMDGTYNLNGGFKSTTKRSADLGGPDWLKVESDFLESVCLGCQFAFQRLAAACLAIWERRSGLSSRP